MEFVEIKRGFWLLNRGTRWYLHFNLPSVVSVEADNESDALARMVARLRHMMLDSEDRPSLRALYASAITWIENYRQ